MHDDFWFMAICWLAAGLIALLLVITAQAQPKQELGWLAQKQMQARQDCAELLKYRMRW